MVVLIFFGVVASWGLDVRQPLNNIVFFFFMHNWGRSEIKNKAKKLPFVFRGGTRATTTS